MIVERKYMVNIVNQAEELVHTIISLEDLYSTIVDLNGKILLKPVGPTAHLGAFYDLFERPMYHELYERIKETLATENEAFYWEMDDGNPDSRISAAPICIDGQQVATWLLCAYNKEQAENLLELYKNQWALSTLISEYLSSLYKLEKREAEVKKAEEALDYELRQKEIITGALARMMSDMDENLDLMFEKTGKLLELDGVILYTIKSSDSKEFSLRKYWNPNGEKPDAAIDVKWNRNSYQAQEKEAIERGGYVIDHGSHIAKVNVGTFQGRMRALMAYPLVVNDVVWGWLAFLHSRSERVWTEAEVLFTRELSRIVRRILDYKVGEGNLKKVNHFLLDTYNYMPVGIFIRENKTGKVLFSNRLLNEKLGYDFTGADSRTFLPDVHDKFDNLAGMRTSNFTNNSIMKWRKYLGGLDTIADISEIQIEWLNREPASLIVIMPAKDE